MRPHDPRDGRPRRPNRMAPGPRRAGGPRTAVNRDLLDGPAAGSLGVPGPRSEGAGRGTGTVRRDDEAGRDGFFHRLGGQASIGFVPRPPGHPPGGGCPLFQKQVAGNPDPREIHRQIFTSRFVGEYTIGDPRFSDRASTIHLYGTDGGSNQFFRGKFQIAPLPPSDPGATPTPGDPYANQVTGVATLLAQNYLQSSAALVLDLNGTTAPGSDPNALPTELTWTYDSNTSAGPYASPSGILPGTGYTQGTGTLEIHWIPDSHPIPGTRGSGMVIVTFQGLINTSQIASGVSKFIS